MERVHGLPLIDSWTSLTWDAKVSCVKEDASIVVQLFELRYDSIGNLFNAKALPIASEYTSQDNAVESNGAALGRIVSTVFSWNPHQRWMSLGARSLRVKIGWRLDFSCWETDLNLFWNPKNQMPKKMTIKTSRRICTTSK